MSLIINGDCIWVYIVPRAYELLMQVIYRHEHTFGCYSTLQEWTYGGGVGS